MVHFLKVQSSVAGGLIKGHFAPIAIALPRRKDTLSVPSQAVILNPSQDSCYKDTPEAKGAIATMGASRKGFRLEVSKKEA